MFLFFDILAPAGTGVPFPVNSALYQRNDTMSRSKKASSVQVVPAFTALPSIYEMFKDLSKLAVEISLHVFPCPHGVPHMHLNVSSPFVENRAWLNDVIKRIEQQGLHLADALVAGNYTIRQSLTDGTKVVVAPDNADESMKALLLQNFTVVLHDLVTALREMFAQWPEETRTLIALKSSYAQVMRQKIERSSDTREIQVKVIGPHEYEMQHFMLSALFGLITPPNKSHIELVAFQDNNPCAPTVRKAFALYATELLRTQVEPELFPLIHERMLKFLNAHAARLGMPHVQAVTTTTENPTDSAIGTKVPVATSGVVDEEHTAVPATDQSSSASQTNNGATA